MNGVWFKFLTYCQNKFKTEIAIPVGYNEIRFVELAHVMMATIESDKFDNLGLTEGFIFFDKFKSKTLKVDKKTDIKLSVENGRLIAATNTGVMNYEIGGYLKDNWQPVRIPALELPAVFTVPFDKLDKAIDSIGTITDHVFFVNTDGKFIVRCKDGQKVIFEQLITDKTGISEEYISAFPLDYIRNILGSNLTKTDIKISMDSNYPVKFEWTLLDNDGGLHQVMMLLAPRIEQPDE